MSPPDPISAAESPHALSALNRWLARLSAQERVAWAMDSLAAPHALSTSFGTQSAVSLHLLTQAKPDIPVILVDTGYLFPETYRFVDDLTERLSLNLKVYRPQVGIAWMEARHGKLWEDGVEGIQRYNLLRKVEPMQRALRELGVRTWIAGLRRTSSCDARPSRTRAWPSARPSSAAKSTSAERVGVRSTAGETRGQPHERMRRAPYPTPARRRNSRTRSSRSCSGRRGGRRARGSAAG